MQKSADETMRKIERVGVIVRSANEEFLVATSALFLHHENERADQCGGQQHADALQRPNVTGHQHFADSLHGERFDWRRCDGLRLRFENCPDQANEYGDGYGNAAPVEAGIFSHVAPRQQNREDNQHRDRADVDKNLHQTDELRAE